MRQRPTRGKTRPGRLAALDRWLLQTRRVDLPAEARCVDLGFGASPHTSVELLNVLQSRWPSATVLATDIDPERVEHAARHLRPGLSFACGGFDLPRERGGAHLIRAMNVLRQYRAPQAALALEHIGAGLVEGGVLLEGTSDGEGQIMAVHLLRRRDGRLHREGLLFGLGEARGFAPIMFRDRLPRDLRDRVQEGNELHRWFGAWTDAWSKVREELAPADAFRASAHELSRRGQPVDLEGLDAGFVLWAPPQGVPER